MEISIIGSGNVATHFAKSLRQVGNSIVAIYSLHQSHAQKLADQIDCPIATNKLDELPQSQLILFAITDDVLSQTAQELLRINPSSKQALWVHTAGCMPLSIFPRNVEKGVIYPLMTLSKDCVSPYTVPLFIEADNEKNLQILNIIAQQISPKVTPISSQQRQTLHLAAVFANNFTNHCYAIAYELLQKARIDPQFLVPIINETTQKLQYLSPLQAQTGPAVRNDQNVINKHLALLNDHLEFQNIYQLMSQSILQLQINKTTKNSND